MYSHKHNFNAATNKLTRPDPDPDKKIDDVQLGLTKRYASLRDVMRKSRLRNGDHELWTMCFDEIFSDNTANQKADGAVSLTP